VTGSWPALLLTFPLPMLAQNIYKRRQLQHINARKHILVAEPNTRSTPKHSHPSQRRHSSPNGSLTIRHVFFGSAADREARATGRASSGEELSGPALCEGPVLRLSGALGRLIASPQVLGLWKGRMRVCGPAAPLTDVVLFPLSALCAQASTVGAAFLTKTIPEMNIKFEIW